MLRQMISLYCRHHHGPRSPEGGLCPACRGLESYALARLARCPARGRTGRAASSCRRCPTHCYRPDMRAQIRQVMRWAGPRMLLHHPLLALRHLFF